MQLTGYVEGSGVWVHGFLLTTTHCSFIFLFFPDFSSVYHHSSSTIVRRRLQERQTTPLHHEAISGRQFNLVREPECGSARLCHSYYVLDSSHINSIRICRLCGLQCYLHYWRDISLMRVYCSTHMKPESCIVLTLAARKPAVINMMEENGTAKQRLPRLLRELVPRQKVTVIV
jgi:hypothetical protein